MHMLSYIMVVVVMLAGTDYDDRSRSSV